jgi:CRP-like cAMP-binding protein
MTGDDKLKELARIGIFADLSRPELHEVDRTFEEEFFDSGRGILHGGIRGSNLYVIVEGQVALDAGGPEPVRLTAGDFFGEMALLLGELPSGDARALTPVRCRVLPGAAFEDFMTAHPRVMYRMLQVVALRLRTAGAWGR